MTQMIQTAQMTQSKEASNHAQVFLRPLCSPLPVGFVGILAATTVLAGLQLGWIPVTESSQVGILVVLVLPVQLLASTMGFLVRDAVAATGMGTLAVAWSAIGVVTLIGAPGARSRALALLLFCLAAALLVSARVALLGNIIAAVVLAVAAVRLVVTGVYEYDGGTTWMHAAGWIGIALAAVALSAILALELQEKRRRVALSHEAGVRAQP